VEAVAILAGIAVALLIVELLLPTGGVLALIGALGLVGAGLLALGDDNDASDYVGPALIALGVLSAGAFFIITPKVIRAHRDEPVRTGWEELVGKEAEVREQLDPGGQVWVDGALWSARVAPGAPAVGIGNRVRIDAVDGLTLRVSPVAEPQPATKGT
jgi:membrane-bound serine protease (ClpP class)